TGRKSLHAAQFSIICRANASSGSLCDCQCPTGNAVIAIFTLRESAADGSPRLPPSPAWLLPPFPSPPCALLPCAGALPLPFAWLRTFRHSRHVPLRQPVVPVQFAAGVFHGLPLFSHR